MLSINGHAQALIANPHVGVTCRSLSECVKEQSKEGNNAAVYQYCITKGYPLPNVDQFKVIDQEVSKVAPKAKRQSTFASWTLS